MILAQSTKKVIGMIGVLTLAVLLVSGCAQASESAIVRLDPATGAVDTEIIEATWPWGILHAVSAPPSAPGDASSEAGPDKAAASANQASVPKTGPGSCPVTQPPDPPFMPPSPYPAEPPNNDRFWYGTDGLWTAVPVDGKWQQLLYGEKMFWWRKGYVWNEEPQPALTVTGRRLDAPAPPLRASRATNAFHSSFGSAMLVGVDIPTPGCWEITGQYRDQELSFVVWVAP